ncbi:tRNA (adenosine(37)-N6)-threonylcarbamoyltransferase complex transferase subunit TsaD [Carnobacteriaceae bacterium zg-ZUI252]|nr:tRNA (adenosine(37)-N6)-threonylcarbamoyltransferase complex transferase subunit TsaD [Carnobacteriaceae bacterium zg-ZUI252]
MKDIMILAIETSCDETSVAVVKNGKDILSNVVASQIKSHQRFGGVVPEVASRHHVEQMNVVLDEALKQANVCVEDVDAIAVTHGPGLVGSLLVGITAAKALAMAYDKPLIATNHMAGHIYAAQVVKPLEFPAVSLLVSGGHTELVYMKEHNAFELIGQTRDDAVGEAYDKIGRLLHLPYPGGKAIDELASIGKDTYHFPRAMINEKHFDFSLSGLKSAVINRVHNANQKGESIQPENLAASFQASVIDVLATKTIQAVKQYEVKQLIVAGGVAANKGLRNRLIQEMQNLSIDVVFPPMHMCGDNAAMVGIAAYYQYLENDFSPLSLNAQPGLSL